jgi:hypothetical protein
MINEVLRVAVISTGWISTSPYAQLVSVRTSRWRVARGLCAFSATKRTQIAGKT